MKKTKKKWFSVIMTIMMVFMAVIPSGITVAAADTVDIYLVEPTNSIQMFRQGSTDEPGGFAVYEGEGAYRFEGGGVRAYCLNPLVLFESGTHTASSLVGFHGITQALVNKVAAGLDYIENHAPGLSRGERDGIGQYWVWDSLNGYGYTLSSLTVTSGLSSSTLNTAIAGANDWVANHPGAIGTGTRYHSASGKQDVAAFSVVYDGYLTLTKGVANNKALTDLCPENYSLAGAVYGVYSDSGLGNKVGELTTTAAGTTNVLSVAQGTYYVKELTAPKGYRLDPKLHTVKVTAGETATLNVADEPLFDPLSLVVYKNAAEGVDKNLSLEGAEYTVKYYKEIVDDVTGLTPLKTWIFSTKQLPSGKVGFHFTDMYKVGGDDLLKTETGIPSMPMGTVTIEETKAPKGLAKTEGIIATRKIEATPGAVAIEAMKDVIDEEKAQTISIKITKVDAETGKPEPQGYGSLEGAEFEVYYFDPLEATDIKIQTVKTDATGMVEVGNLKPGKYTVKEIKAPAGYLLNSEEQVVLGRITEINTANFEYVVKVPEKPITVEIAKTGLGEHGVSEMVSGAELQLINAEGKVLETWTTDANPKTIKGLPAGKYTVKETKVPDGYLAPTEDFTFEVKEIEEVQKVEIFNEAIPEIKTEAFFEGEVKNTLPKKEVTLYDKVSYDKLIVGKEYTLKGKLVDAEDPNTVIATGETTFVAEQSEGSVNVEFKFDASELEGKTMVVFEDIYKNGRLLATHAEITDEDQTVTVPKVKTTATDKIDGDKDLYAGEKQTIVDVVEYNKLTVGKEYIVKGTLMVKGTKKPLLVDGKEVKAETTFIAEEENGKVSLEFTFNATALRGERVVVFESVYQNGIEVAVHADIEDEDQSVDVPKIGTTATSQMDGTKSVLPVKNVTVTDTIKYENLIVGKIYNVYGKLINKTTKEVIVSAEGSFMAETKDGEVKLDFTFDATKLAGTEVVVFEKVFSYNPETDTEKLIASHEDPSDEGQTVKVEKPEIKTTATSNGSKIVELNETATVVDKVEFKNLVAGEEYTVKGELIDKATKKVIATAETKFIAKAANGEVEMTFTFNTAGLEEKELVVFEEIFARGQKIGEHKDINDKGQTVKVAPKPTTPSTGDSSTIIPYMTLIISALGMVILSAKRKTNK